VAKVIRGGRHSKDPLIRYAIFNTKTCKTAVRRAAVDEHYKHSRNRKVKKARETFAQAVVRYSNLDIVTKQAYTEAVRWKILTPIDPYARRIYEKVRRIIVRRPPGPPGVGVPYYVWTASPFYSPTVVPAPTPTPVEWVSWEEEYTPKKYLPPWGHVINEEYSKREMPNPARAPLPPDIQEEEKNINKDRTPARTPMYIVVEIDPAGWTGLLYEGWVRVKTEYHEIKRWVSSHKKEVLIIVAIGAIALFAWEFFMGGALVSTGAEVLVNGATASTVSVGALGLTGLPIKEIWGWYRKHIILEWAEQLDIWAWNDTRAHKCYKEVSSGGDTVYYTFYEGPDAAHKGRVAAWAQAKVDFEKKTASISYGCGESDDRIAVFLNGALLFTCNIGPSPFDQVELWNNTMKMWGRARIEEKGNKRIYHFEDRPYIFDEDYNDAIVIVEYDNEHFPVSIEAIEGEHMDEHFIYYRGQLIAHFP